MPALVRTATAFLLLAAAGARAHQGGAPDGYSGAPPLQRSCVECHTGSPVQTPPTFFLFLNDPYLPSGYTPGSLQIGMPDIATWGFQMTLLDSAGNMAGLLKPRIFGEEDTQRSDNPFPEPDYLNHTRSSSLSPLEGQVWDFDWFSPPQGRGPLTAYVMVVTGNGDSSATGDQVWSITRTLQEGNSGGSGISWTVPHDEHDFGIVPVNSTRLWSILLYNPSPTNMIVGAMTGPLGPVFHAGEALPIVLAPGEDRMAQVGFTPPLTVRYQAPLALLYQDGSLLDSLHLEGRGSLPLAPEPFALLAPADGATVPAGQIEFRWQATVNRDSSDSAAVAYELEIDRESDFLSSTTWPTGLDTSFVLPSSEFEADRIHFWRVRALDTNTEGSLSIGFRAFVPSTSAAPEPDQPLPTPAKLSLHPNPFNSRSMVQLRLARSGQVRVRLFDLLGRELRSLYNGPASAGLLRLPLDGQELASGLYLLTADGEALGRRRLALRALLLR